MSNYLLKTVYKSIYCNDFNPTSFEARMQMQKSIYLLQELGVSIGDYNFKWYKHGPYSQGLQNDILEISEAEEVPVQYSVDAQVVIDSLKEAIDQDNIKYGKCEWAECLGSLHYIKDNILPSSATNEEILKELENRKTHLNERQDNEKAMEILDSLFM